MAKGIDFSTYDSKGDDPGSSPTMANLGSKIKKLLKGKSDAGAGDLADVTADPASAKKGGKVKKTGKALIHKGERVLTKKQAKKYSAGKSGPRKRA